MRKGGFVTRKRFTSSRGERVEMIRDRLALRQLTRFSTAGVAIAIISVTVYWVAAVAIGMNALIANFISYVANVSLGFIVHRDWTFRELSASGTSKGAMVKYICVSLVALALNTIWTAILVMGMDRPAWTAIVPMVFVTPLVTFVINRHWVFGLPRGG